MRTRVFVACLIFGPALAGCQLHRKPPYARDPDLLHYKPTLSSSAEVLTERKIRRKPTPPPKPSVAWDKSAPTTPPTSLTPPPKPDAMQKPASPYGAIQPKAKAAEAPKELTPDKGIAVARPEPRAATTPPDRLPDITAPPDLPGAAPHVVRSPKEVEVPPIDRAKPLEEPNGAEPGRSRSAPPKASLNAANEPPHDIVIPPTANNIKNPAPTPKSPLVIAAPGAGNNEPLKLPDLVRKAPASGTPRTVPGRYGCNDNYTWLQGVVEKSFRGVYSLRYRDPSDEDQYGGKVRLEDDPRLNDYKHGDAIAVTGQLEPQDTASDAWAYPRFRVKEIANPQSR